MLDAGWELSGWRAGGKHWGKTPVEKLPGPIDLIFVEIIII